MEQTGSDLSALALVVAIAVFGGLVLGRLRQPVFVAYILVGIVLGPQGVGLIDDTPALTFVAELSIVLLVFLIGLELSLRAFVAVLPTAILCTLLQILASVGCAVGLAHLIGKPLHAGVLFGFLVSLSSTLVAVGMLTDLGQLRRRVGRITIGMLVAQNLAIVPMLIVLDALGDRGFDRIVLLKLLITAGVLATFVWALSRRRRSVLPARRWLNSRPEALPLAALALCFAAAAASGALGLSTALGAFLAGLLIGNSTDRAATVRATRSIRTVLLVAFFLSIGFLVDLRFAWENVGVIVGWLVLITVVKTAIHVGALHFLGEPWEDALPAAAIMGQIGEFSFVLAAVGAEAGLLTADGGRMVVAVITLSLLTSPFWQMSARRLRDASAQGARGVRPILGQAYATERAALRRGTQTMRDGADLFARAVRGGERRRPSDAEAADFGPEARPGG